MTLDLLTIQQLVSTVTPTHKKRVRHKSTKVNGKNMSSESYPLNGIAEPGANDVLCGRGGASNNHIGNRRFRMLVNEHRMRYKNSCKLDKPKVAREIMMIWRNQTPPGRFLCKVAGTKLWNDVGDQKAREKASQCLRERDPGDATNVLSADEGKGNSMFSKNMLYEHDDESPNKLCGESLSAFEGFCNKSDRELLPEKLQRDFHEQQCELIKLNQLQRKVEKMLLQQRNFTKLWSELTQDALQRQDQQQLHRVQWDLLKRREKLEQQQLALMRAIKLTTHLQRAQDAHSFPSTKMNIEHGLSSWTAIATQPSINDTSELNPLEEIICRKVSTSTSSNSSEQNSEALLLSAESTFNFHRDGDDSVGMEYHNLDWSQNSFFSGMHDADAIDIDSSLKSLCHYICDKKIIDGVNSIAYSSHSEGILGATHSLLSVKSYKDSFKMDCSSSCVDPKDKSEESVFVRQLPCSDGSPLIDEAAAWVTRSRFDKGESFEKQARATAALASTLSTMSFSDGDIASIDIASEERDSMIHCFSKPHCWEQIFMPSYKDKPL